MLIVIFLTFTGCSTSGGAFSREALEAAGITETIVQLEPRPGVTLKFLLIKPRNPIASVMLFPGGPGLLKLSNAYGRPRIGRINDVYLVRNRYNYAKEGLMVALVDIPSDCKDQGEMGVRTGRGSLYKMSREQVADIEAVARYLKGLKAAPVWVMGTSRGTISVANAGIRGADGIDGLVFTSTLSTRGEKHKFLENFPNAVLDMDLDKVALPALIVAHRDDYCLLSHSSDAAVLKDKLVIADEVQVAYFTGGKKQKGSDCGWFSPHSFYGIEERVDKQIAQYIKSKHDPAYSTPAFQSEYLSLLTHSAHTFEDGNGNWVKMVLARPKAPRGVFVMFRDMGGVLNIFETDEGPIMQWKLTLVSRCMDRLAKQGYAVALVGAVNAKGHSWEERSSAGYLKKVEPVFAFLENEFDLPIWCVGHGPGGFSAINATLHLPQVDALMLISPLDRAKDVPTQLSNGFLDLNLEKIDVPTYIIAHTKDSSGMSGRRAAERVAAALVNSPLVSVDILSEGRPNSRLGSRWKKLPHFFVGRSDIVVESMVDFTEMNLL
jgi:pimeloyl-ACP methyl ester carboxylesterase